MLFIRTLASVFMQDGSIIMVMMILVYQLEYQDYFDFINLVEFSVSFTGSDFVKVVSFFFFSIWNILPVMSSKPGDFFVRRF